MKAHLASSFVQSFRSKKRGSAFLVGLLVIGVFVAGFMAVSGGAAALGFHSPASVTSRTATAAHTAAVPGMISAPAPMPLTGAGSITGFGSPLTENFDTLAQTLTNIAWVDNSTLSGGYSSRTTYNAGTGGSNTGALYSFGIAGVNPVSDRALGGIASGGTGTFYYGFKLTNSTGSAIGALSIAYTGEQWRDAGAATPAAQTVGFQYQVANAGTITDADVPTTGWTTFSALSFTSPIFVNPGAGVALDGNVAANRTAKSATLTLPIPATAGQEIWIRWEDLNDAGNDHGLAIDDLSITALQPTIITSVGSLPDFGSVTVGSASAEQTYTVSGANLTADITVTAPSTDFQVSKTTGSGFGPSITFTQAGGTVATQTVFVHFTPQSTGSKSGNVSNASSGATTQDVAVSGTGTAAVCGPQSTVYVDDNFANPVIGQDPDGVGPATNFGCDSFATIQGGVAGVTTGGTVIVNAGTYNGPQILIDRSMSVLGAGLATTIIDGLSVAPPSGGLVAIAPPLGDTGNVTFSGFTITNPGVTGSLKYAMFVKPLDPATTVTISNNRILGSGDAGPAIFDLGIWIYRNRGAVVFDHNDITNVGGNKVLIEQPLNSTNVHHNTIAALGTSSMYFNFTYDAENISSLQRVADNTINGSLATAINFNPSSVNVAAASRHGKYSSVQITGNVITGVGAARSAIALLNDSQDPTGIDGAVESPIISGNIITGTNAATSNGIRFRGLVTNASITNNDIRNTARGFFGEPPAGLTHTATGTQLHVNNIVGNTSGMDWSGTAAIDAENNWWGCSFGPGAGGAGCTGTANGLSGSGAGLIDANPWLVLGTSATPNPIPPFGMSTVTADMRFNSGAANTSGSGFVPLTPVAWSATNGTMAPPSGTITAGQAMSTFTSTSASSGTGCATVDSQLTCTSITVATAVAVSLPHVTGPTGSLITVPITVDDLTGKGVKAYDLQVTFDSTKIVPQGTPYDTAGTLSSGMLITPNASNAGHLIISAFQGTDLSGSGTLINLKFMIVGAPGQSTPLTFQDYTDPGTIFHPGFRFNAGTPVASPLTNGSVTINGPTAANGTVSGQITDEQGRPVSGAVVRLNGGQARKTITDANGDYHFEDVPAADFYTVTPTRANFGFNPAQRSFSVLGNKTEALFTGVFGGETANPLDTAEYFVRQHYLDVLGREPDEAGFNYWSDQINQCLSSQSVVSGQPSVVSQADCVSARRIDVAAAFFIAHEFQVSGAYIYNLYNGGLGRRPGYTEYAVDRQQVVGGPELAAGQAAFAESFVARPEFVQKYEGRMTAGSFVDALLTNVQQTAGLDLSQQRESLLSSYQAGATPNESRSLVLRAIADNAEFKQGQYNKAFVLTEYFSYLRRDADGAGMEFWLNVLNTRTPGNYRGMVCAFMTAAEYQQRFGTLVTHSNGECGR